MRTFAELQRLDFGFDRDHIVTFTTDPGLNGYSPERANTLRQSLQERVRAMPGVVSVALGGLGLTRGTGIKTTVAREGEKASPSDFLNTSKHASGFARVFRDAGLAADRWTAADAGRSRAQTAASRGQSGVRACFLPAEPSVAGRYFGSGSVINEVATRTSEIVGVVTDAKYRSVREPVPPTIYSVLGRDENRSSRFILHVRTSMRPESLIEPVRGALRALDPALPFIEVRTLAEEVDASLWSERLTAALASVFGGIAALLAAVGLYGLLGTAHAQALRDSGAVAERVCHGPQPLARVGGIHFWHPRSHE